MDTRARAGIDATLAALPGPADRLEIIYDFEGGEPLGRQVFRYNLRGDGQTGGSFGQSADNQSGPSNGSNGSSGSTSLQTLADPGETYYLTPGGVNMRV